MKKRNSYLTATLVMGIILSVVYGLLALIFSLFSIFSSIGKFMTIYLILNFVLVLVGTLSVNKARTTGDKDSCTLGGALFTISCVLCFNVISLLCSIFALCNREGLKEAHNIRVCNDCNAVVDNNAVFCPSCGGGTSIKTKGMSVKKKIIIWSVCSAVIFIFSAVYAINDTQKDFYDFITEDFDSSLLEETKATESKGSATKEFVKEVQKEVKQPTVPLEYKNALDSAKTYSDLMNMSKRAIYDQLVSNYGDGFSAEAAQYAVDNLKVDYKANALKSAKTYSEFMSLAPEGVYEQLTSEYGDKFEPEEAQYAVDMLFK